MQTLKENSCLSASALKIPELHIWQACNSTLWSQTTSNDPTQTITHSTTMITMKTIKACKKWLHHPIQAWKGHTLSLRIVQMPLSKRKSTDHTTHTCQLHILFWQLPQHCPRILKERHRLKHTLPSHHQWLALKILSSPLHCLTLSGSLRWAIYWQWTPPGRQWALHSPRLHERFLKDLQQNHTVKIQQSPQSSIDPDISNYIKHCPSCIQQKTSQATQPMLPKGIPFSPWQEIATGIFTFGQWKFLLMCDTFSKYPFLFETFKNKLLKQPQKSSSEYLPNMLL